VPVINIYKRKREIEKNSLHVNNKQWVADSTMSSKEMICRHCQFIPWRKRRRTTQVKEDRWPRQCSHVEEIDLYSCACVCSSYYRAKLTLLGVDYSVCHHYHTHTHPKTLCRRHDASYIRERETSCRDISPIQKKTSHFYLILIQIWKKLNEEKEKVNSNCCCSISLIDQRTVWCYIIEPTSEHLTLWAI
jgi:hypothetical protein